MSSLLNQAEGPCQVESTRQSSTAMTRSTLASTVSAQSNPFTVSGNTDGSSKARLQASEVCDQKSDSAQTHSLSTLLNPEQPSLPMYEEARSSNPFSESSIADRVKQSRRGRQKRWQKESATAGGQIAAKTTPAKQEKRTQKSKMLGLH